MTVSYQPWYVSCTWPQWDIPLAKDSGVEDITNAPIGTFVMTFRSSQGQDTIGTGTFSVKALTPAEVYYAPSAQDVASAFTGSLYISAIFTGGGKVVYDPIAFVISAS